MSDFSLSWELSRQRFLDTISGLSSAQLNWRLHEQALSIGQMAVHVAGVEVSFASQLLGSELDVDTARLKCCATDGVVNDKAFPYADAELEPTEIARLFEISKALLQPIITSPSPEILGKEIVSALGPVITGEGAFTRLAFHSAYHQGQAYLICTAPGFPAE